MKLRWLAQLNLSLEQLSPSLFSRFIGEITHMYISLKYEENKVLKQHIFDVVEDLIDCTLTHRLFKVYSLKR